ncbi:hypothetical protein B0J11DRAFT_567056 [Dendryphion nanum]|uniref:F-box domain-containing protein n=1 Tax=Dendryphion nanum TaxID=256645 RepID=A0A9P9E0M4_9PLEO|nr:hypothetical protein B0J11DRAFT_567056 [Dendryphion nanum]
MDDEPGRIASLQQHLRIQSDRPELSRTHEARVAAARGSDSHGNEHAAQLANLVEQGTQSLRQSWWAARNRILAPAAVPIDQPVPRATLSFASISQGSNSSSTAKSPPDVRSARESSNYRGRNCEASNHPRAHADYNQTNLDENAPKSSIIEEAVSISPVINDPVPIAPSISSRLRTFRAQQIANIGSLAGQDQTTAMKRSRWDFESSGENDIKTLLGIGGAVALIAFRSEAADPNADDVWPNYRSATQLPARYFLLRKDDLETDTDNCQYLDIRDLQGSLLQGSSIPLKRRYQLRDESQEAEPLPVDPSRMDPPPTTSGWPAGRLPTELFEEISSYLSRDEVKSMRLVCREFDRHISQVLFDTAVVPFNTEIYGMLGQKKPDFKGKKKIKIETQSLVWQNANGDEIYNGHGLDVFRGFGKHILRFGMTFEMNENSLNQPPRKPLTENHTSFWGSYDWPVVEYHRFEDVAGLESAADETLVMKTAFSELTKVRELALSVDSGLGWLNGPDRSIRARILQQPPTVFGRKHKLLDRRSEAQKELWDHINLSHKKNGSDIKEATLYRTDPKRPLVNFRELSYNVVQQPLMPYMDSQLIHGAPTSHTADITIPSSFDDPDVLERFLLPHSALGTGFIYTSLMAPSDAAQLMSPVIPAELTRSQKERLLETEWAQRAFTSSWILSIIDNPGTFEFIHTLRVSQLSDRFLPIFQRRDFWDNLPNLNELTLKVIPGWRDVFRDDKVGHVKTPRISPSDGIDLFYNLLKDTISTRSNIKKLTVGWVTGGEHAEGVHARNRLLLPAPILPKSMFKVGRTPDTMSNTTNNETTHTMTTTETDATTDTEKDNGIIEESLLRFPYVTDLTFVNCWFTPPVLTQLVRQHDKFNLKNLVLDSVSLTPILRPVVYVHHANNAQNHHPQQNQPQVQINVAGFQALQAAAHQTTQQAANAISNGNANGNALPHAIPPAASGPLSQLRIAPREGSWLNILDIISPGINLTDFQSQFSRADPERITSLETIRFVSCGYAILPYAQTDQNNIFGHSYRSHYFTKRANLLAPAMLSAKCSHLGEIVQEGHEAELAALAAGWDFKLGWDDLEAAIAPEFDGVLSGGTGRFSGVVARVVK